MNGENEKEGLRDKLRKSSNNYAKFSSLAFQMAFIIGGGTYLGSFLDENQKNEFPIWTLILSLSSVALSLYYVIKQIINRD